MRDAVHTLKILGQIVGGFVLFGLTVAIPIGAGAGLGFVGVILYLLASGWALYAFLSYRQSRQDELTQVLAAAAAGGVPLVPALDSYLHDRPGQRTLRAVLGVLAYFILPLYAYTRLCIGWRSYERLVGELIVHLEQGESLSDALRAVPGVVGREVRVAAAVGEATGSLATCLRLSRHERWSAAWFEVLPRLLYPLILLVFVFSITTFLMQHILPRFRRIFQEFGASFPPATQSLYWVWDAVESYLSLIALAAQVGLVVLAAVVANPTIRWYTPVLGRLYRWGVQAEVLRALGRLFAAGWTAPQALKFLRDSDDLPSVVQRRVTVALAGVERGDALADALERADLLPAAMGPLVRSSERVRTLPWALGELGDHLSGRAFRVVRRFSLVASPLMVVAVGGVVGFVAVAMFLPLIELLSRLSE